MLSFVRREQKLNILLKPPVLDDFTDAAFFLMVCAQFCTHTANNYWYYAGFFLFLGLSMAKVLLRIRYDGVVNVPAIFWWYLSFALFSLASVLWAEYPSASLNMMTRMVQILAIVFCMSQNYATRKGFSRCIKLVCWAGIVCALYIYIMTPYERWFAGKLGYAVTGANANTVGMIFTLCILITFYYAYYQKKLFYYIPLIIEFLLVILTSSRKSLLTVLCSIVILIIIKDMSLKLVLRIMLAVGLVVLVGYALINVEQLYSVAGRRLESMLQYILNDSGDFSMYSRDIFIDYARQFFYERPIFGSGIANYLSKLGAAYGYYTYAHNNYYELLVDIGIVGFAIYYSFYAYLVVRLGKIAFLDGEPISKIMLMIMISIMVCEFGIVLYYSVYTLAFICITFLYICVYDREHGKELMFSSESSKRLLQAERI